MALSAGEIAGILQEMENNGNKYSSAKTVEQQVAAHDANVAWGNYLQQNGYTTKYNSITGDWQIAAGSLYGTPTQSASQQPNKAASNSYFPAPNIPIQQQPVENGTSLLQADTPNIGGLIGIGAVLAFLFLLK